MKITILTGSKGEKALYLYDFFKEGNRLTIACLLTSDPQSELAKKFADAGIEVIPVSESVSAIDMADTLKDRGVELLVEDDFEGPFPSELKDAASLPMVTITTKENGPLEVIEANKKINAAFTPHPETPKTEEKPKETIVSQGKTVPSPSEQEQEWAEALNFDLKDPSQAKDITSEASEINPETTEDSAQAPQPEQPGPERQAPSPQTGMRQPFSQVQPPFQRQFQQQYQQPSSGQSGNGQFDGQQQPAPEPMPKTYLVWSVIITILCCLIPGIVAIVYSASVSSKYYAGNVEGAKKASRNAQIWCIISVVTGIIWATLYLPLTLFAN